MTHNQASLDPALDQTEIMAVYQQLGLSAASDRANFTAMFPQAAPTVHLTVRIGSDSLPA